MTSVKISEIKFEPSIYPRSKWNAATVSRYADAMLAGDEFPPLGVVLINDKYVLVDGKHRMEAAKKAEVEELPVTVKQVPDDMSIKYFAATLSAKHGDRMSNTDLKELALEEFDPDLHKEESDWEQPDAQAWGKSLGISKSTVYEWVAHLISKYKANRQSNAWKLYQLGWTQQEISERLGCDRSLVSLDVKDSEIGKIHTVLGDNWNAQSVAEWANRMGVSLTDATSSAISNFSDEERIKHLGIKIQPYDVWNFSQVHDLMGDRHPGRIPGQLVVHTLWHLTKPGDLVLDPMAGSGTVLDACLLMGRKCRGYDIDERHDRIDIEQHDLSNGWPEKASKADLIFWDPPYFDKMDSSTIGSDGYIEGSISSLSPDEYMDWISKRLSELNKTAKDGARIAFLMSDWDPENAKRHADHPGIFVWDYAKALLENGWNIERHIQAPLSTQQVHPDIVNKFRESRRMARLGRYLLVGRKA